MKKCVEICIILFKNFFFFLVGVPNTPKILRKIQYKLSPLKILKLFRKI